MGRPVDPDIRSRLLDRIIAYVWEHGISDFSLRPLAEAVSSSPRNIAYHFGSREDLLCLIFDTVRERVYEEFRAVQEDASSLEDALNRHWDWLAEPKHRRMERLLYEMFGISVNNPERYNGYARRIADEWLKHISDLLERFGIKDGPGQELATLIMTVFHGVTLDLAATDDVLRIEKSVRTCISQVKLLTNS